MRKQSQFGDSDKTKIEVRICCHTGIQMIEQGLNLQNEKRLQAYTAGSELS